MKSKIFTAFVAASASLFMAQAEILYADNTATEDASNNLYATFENALQAAVSGDTIYVLGSGTTYGTPSSITKKLHIYGPGYFLSQNENTQVNKSTARFYDITFASGSDGSVIMGIHVEHYTYLQTDNVTFTNCYFQSIFYFANSSNNITNTVIKESYFGSYLTITGFSAAMENTILTNNIFRNYAWFTNNSSGVISNNVFESYLHIGTASGFEVHNNLFVGTSTTSSWQLPAPGIGFSHNISIQSNLGGTTNNNQQGVDRSTIFDVNQTTSDGVYILSGGSPANAAGLNGTDIGIFGGASPYRLSGLPYLPNINDIATGGVVTGNTLPVRIKVQQ